MLPYPKPKNIMINYFHASMLKTIQFYYILIVETEIRTVDFRLNWETRKPLISQRSRISARANDKWPNIWGNHEKITNEFRENSRSYFESA